MAQGHDTFTPLIESNSLRGVLWRSPLLEYPIKTRVKWLKDSLYNRVSFWLSFTKTLVLFEKSFCHNFSKTRMWFCQRKISAPLVSLPYRNCPLIGSLKPKPSMSLAHCPPGVPNRQCSPHKNVDRTKLICVRFLKRVTGRRGNKKTPSGVFCIGAF